MMLGNSFYSNDESTRNLYVNIGKNFILFYALAQYLRKFICSIIIKSLILVLYLPILLTLCNFSKKFLPPPQKMKQTYGKNGTIFPLQFLQ